MNRIECRVTSSGARSNRAASLFVALGLGAALSLTSGAMARQAAEAPLGGPEITDRAPPGERPFGPQSTDKGNAKFARRGAPQAAFMRAVRDLDGDLALTEAQREQIKTIQKEFGDKMKAFREEHAEEFKALRPEGGPRRGEEGEGGGPRRGRPEGGEPRSKEDREKLRALMQKAPKPDETQARQWAVLNPNQQAFVKQRMEQMKERGPEGRGGPEGRRGPEGRGGPEGKRGPEGRGGPEGRRGPEGDGGKRRRPPEPKEPAPEMDEEAEM